MFFITKLTDDDSRLAVFMLLCISSVIIGFGVVIIVFFIVSIPFRVTLTLAYVAVLSPGLPSSVLQYYQWVFPACVAVVSPGLPWPVLQ